MQASAIHSFIQRMALRNAVNAGLQRVSIYQKNTKAYDCNRIQFRGHLKSWLTCLQLRYSAQDYNADRYCTEIVLLQRELVNGFAHVLKDGTITIGVCQKPISLFLKYLWLLGDSVKMPIFPPLDRGVLRVSKVPNPPKWPDINTTDEYRRICHHIDNYAKQNGYGSGSEWEAENWSDEPQDG